MDVQKVRAKFPALSKEQVFFDNAGGSQVLGTVVDSITDYLVNSNVQLGATYGVGKKASARYEEAYQAAAKYMNASREEIVLGASTTQLFRNVSAALVFEPGDELVLSGIDHEANIAPWLDLAERQGLVVKWWLPASRDEPKLLPAGLEPLLSPRTRLVACTHASNILGTIHDLAAVVATVRASPAGRRAMVCADGVAYAPHRPVDVRALGVDLYAFSWYKVYGPHVAVLYARADTAQAQAPDGGALRSLGHFFNPHATLENKIGLAGASYELASGIPAVVAYAGGEVAWGDVVAQEAALQGELLGYLSEKTPGDVTIHGERGADPRVRVPTVSFTAAGWDSRALVEAVGREAPALGFRWGAFYSNRLVHEFLGLGASGVVRVSLVHYNTLEEVRTFIAALDKVLSSKK